MIHIENNKCPVCLKDGLSWHLDICKSDMQMFKCGHGICKDCYIKLRNSQSEFSCPYCRENSQVNSIEFGYDKREKWTTFAEWYNEYEIFIKAGVANNVVKNTNFGKQLLRLIKENRKNRKLVTNS